MSLNCILGQMSLKVTKNVISGPLVPIPNRRYRYPKGGTDTLLLFFRKQIPESNLSIDTQGEYRYPGPGTDTLRLGTDTLEQRIGWKNTPNGSKQVPTVTNGQKHIWDHKTSLQALREG
ncbi:hypothetical protein GQ457_15G020370 [Hibiscus cannabinus]